MSESDFIKLFVVAVGVINAWLLYWVSTTQNNIKSLGQKQSDFSEQIADELKSNAKALSDHKLHTSNHYVKKDDFDKDLQRLESFIDKRFTSMEDKIETLVNINRQN